MVMGKEDLILEIVGIKELSKVGFIYILDFGEMISSAGFQRVNSTNIL